MGEFPDRLQGDGWCPSADVFETETALVIRLELPGVQSGEVPKETDERIQGLFGAALRRARKTGNRQVVMRVEAWFRRRGLPIPE